MCWKMLIVVLSGPTVIDCVWFALFPERLPLRETTLWGITIVLTVIARILMAAEVIPTPSP